MPHDRLRVFSRRINRRLNLLMDTLRPDRLPAIAKQTVFASIALALFLGALWILPWEVAGVHFAGVLARFRALPSNAILLALGVTFSRYAALIAYSAIKRRKWARSVMPERRDILAVPLALWLFGALWFLLGSIMLGSGLYLMDHLD